MTYVFINVILLMVSSSVLTCKGTTSHDGSDFLKICQTKTFVDKTLLIKAVLRPGRTMLITAPRKFGKSTNLQMIKVFLSTNSFNLQNVRDIFTTLRIYEGDRTFFEDNFGKRPVLFVDLSTKTVILRMEDAVEELKKSIRRSYSEHVYLMKSAHLDEYDKVECKNWITDYTNMQECDMSEALPNLVKYLEKHFKRPVIALIDGYDDIISSALTRVVDDSLFERLTTLISAVLQNLLDGKLVKLDQAVITGVCQTSSGEIMDVKFVETFSFLNGHPFAKYYGFSLEEVNSIFGRLPVKPNDTLKESAISYYKGYNSKDGHSVFNPYSISNFATSGKVAKYMEPSEFIENSYYLLKYPTIEDCFNNLLGGTTFKATIYRTISKEQLIELKDLYHRMVDDPPDINLFTTHLMELGYLSYVETTGGGKNMKDVQAPNMEVKELLLGAYKKYYSGTYDLNRTYVGDMGYVEFKSVLMNCREYTDKVTYEKKLADSIY